jgi:hypothetical protein
MLELSGEGCYIVIGRYKTRIGPDIVRRLTEIKDRDRFNLAAGFELVALNKREGKNVRSFINAGGL